MVTELNSYGQVSSEDAGQIFRDHLRGLVRQMISEVLASEVNELCVPNTNLPTAIIFVRVAAVGVYFLKANAKPSFGLVYGSEQAIPAAKKLSLRLTKRLATRANCKTQS